MIKELVTNSNGIDAKEPVFYCKDWLPIPRNTTTMISAPGGTGKSFLTIQIAIRIISKNPTHRILIWNSEDPLFYTKSRIDKVFERIMPKEIQAKKEQILNQIDIIGADKDTIYFDKLDEEQLKILGDELVTSYNAVILDPLLEFFGGNENDNGEARAFIKILNKIATHRLLSIILIHHHNKGNSVEGTRTRGASAFIDAVRLLYTLNTIKTDENNIHPTQRLIKIEKDNWGVRQLLNKSELELEVLPYNVKEINSNELKEGKSNSKSINLLKELKND